MPRLAVKPRAAGCARLEYKNKTNKLFSEPVMTKNRKLSVTTLAIVSAASLCAAAAMMSGTLTAAADREVTLTGSSIFYTSNQAEIGDQTVGDKHYTSFVFAEDDSAVTYRKNLAYRWFDSQTQTTGAYLSTEIGFTSLAFESFTIKFQSQQYTQTEDEVTENFITFVADDEAEKVYAVIGGENELTLEELKTNEDYTALSYSNLEISFTDYANGVYTVEITDGSAVQSGKFENVGGTYARYVSSSSSTSVIPLTYSAQFAEGSSEAATMVLYSFNGQSFELTGEDGARHITDNVAPVICLNEDVRTLEYGRDIDLDYVVIDMLATSPRATLNYYVLKNSQVTAGGLNDTGRDENGTLPDDAKTNFVSVSSSDISPVIKGGDVYNDGIDDKAEFKTECLVKVYFFVQDTTATGYNHDEVFLEWYVPAEYLCSVESDGETYSFIRATDDGEGASYAENAADYQELVNDALANQQASAGDDKYLYLPSFEGYVNDNITAYRDLKFSIYYISNDSGSSSSLSYNELAIELESDGLYRFVIYATDAAGNDMYYLDGEGNKVKFAASELTELLKNPAESDLADYIPVYSFEVNYGGLTVTDPEGQNIGFVGTEYSASDFEVTGLSSNYTTTYTLFLFDRYKYSTAEGGGPISYSEFLLKMKDLLNDPETRAEYFTAIVPVADLVSTDENYDQFADYEWKPDSLSFIPQDENAFYVIMMEAVDNTFQTKSIQSYMGISVSAAADPLPGENDWLENNVASVVLLCIAGVALIGIILLIVIKPKDKGDIDEIADKEAKKVSSRKKVNKKSE